MLAVATVTAERERSNRPCLAPHPTTGGPWGQTGAARASGHLPLLAIGSPGDR